MTIKVGAAGGAAFPWPTAPEPTKGPDGVLSNQGDEIPHNGTLINQIKMPTAFSTTATGEYEGLLNGASVWTVAPTAVNAACNGWAGIVSHWYDSVNDRLYVFGINTGTAPDTIYTAYITLETGAVTNVGNTAFSTDPSSISVIGNCATSRSAIDSGNFVLRTIDRTITINESTGAEVSNVAESNRSGIIQPGTFSTLDGTVTTNGIINFSTPDSYFDITRSGTSARIPMKYFFAFANNASSGGIYFSNWGDKVKVHSPAGSNNPIIRTFPRADFESWIKEMADFMGI